RAGRSADGYPRLAHAVQETAQLVDPCGDAGRAAGDIRAWLAGRPFARGGQHGDQQRGLLARELARADAEVMARGGLGAIDAVAPFNDVEIDLHDPPLGP